MLVLHHIAHTNKINREEFNYYGGGLLHIIVKTFTPLPMQILPKVSSILTVL